MADTMLSFGDNSLSNEFMTMEQLKAACPSAFKTEATNPNVSKRYTIATTMDVVNDLAKNGWYPVQAKQCRPKKGSSGIRSFHMIAFQNPNLKVPNKDGGIDSYPRIILTNSHDGFNSFKFMIGFFRLVCSNGLVVGENMMPAVCVRHINYSFEVLRTVLDSMIESIPNIVGTMEKMKTIEISNEDKKEIATSVAKIRKDVPDDEKFNISEEEIMEILAPEREEDKSDDLWTIFNVCQEKLINGGFSLNNKNNKSRKQRSITSAKKDIEYNRRLWDSMLKYMPATVAA